jgi:hypothetical protein
MWQFCWLLFMLAHLLHRSSPPRFFFADIWPHTSTACCWYMNPILVVTSINSFLVLCAWSRYCYFSLIQFWHGMFPISRILDFLAYPLSCIVPHPWWLVSILFSVCLASVTPWVKQNPHWYRERNPKIASKYCKYPMLTRNHTVSKSKSNIS